jgi:hypothetical protein
VLGHRADPIAVISAPSASLIRSPFKARSGCRLIIKLSLRAGSAASDLDDAGRTHGQAAIAWLDTITARPAFASTPSGYLQILLSFRGGLLPSCDHARELINAPQRSCQ